MKSQKKAMKTAQIHEKTQFAQRIKTEFLKGKWSKEFVKEFQDPTNFKKLWWGETPYISLGTQSMTALKVTRNAMAKRVVDTTGKMKSWCRLSINLHRYFSHNFLSVVYKPDSLVTT